MARRQQTHLAERHTWRLSNLPYLPQRWHVTVVGVGGTGSEVISNLVNLHLALIALGKGGLEVVAIDPDRVSEANIVRQRFSPNDIGRYKAVTLCDRINLAFPNVHFEAIPVSLEDYLKREYFMRSTNVLISCVDSRASRATIHDNLLIRKRLRADLWIDTGNNASSGQVIMGTPQFTDRQHRLPCASEIHPELIDTSLPDDNAPSCSARESLTSQGLFVNKRVALAATDLLWELLREGEIVHHGSYFNLGTRTEAPIPVPAAPPARVQHGSRKRAA